MSQKKTKEEFVFEMTIKHPEIIVIGTYINNATTIECICKKCNTSLYKSPNYYLTGHGCAICNSTKLSKESLVNRLKKINKNINVLGDYKNARTKIKCSCKICNNIWYSTPDSLLKGHGCRECGYMTSSKKQLKMTNDFEKDFYAAHDNLKILSTYKGARSDIRLKCTECGYEFERTATNSLKSNYGCPKCNNSKGEKTIEMFLIENNIEFESQKKYIDLLGIGGRNLSFDFYLPKNNLLIEYQGEFHDGTAWQQDTNSYNTQKEHDKRKKQYANDNSINLLEIWYWDFLNIKRILFDAVFGGVLDDSD